MDIKEAANTPAAALAGAELSIADRGATARRRLVAAGLAGVATSLLPWFNPRSIAASTPSTDTGTAESSGGTAGTADTAAATTTTAPPKRPTEADIVLLDFAQSLELTVRDLYDVAIASGVFAGLPVDDINAIREAHEGYATAIAGVIGRHATNAPNSILFGQRQSTFTGEAGAVAKAAAELEDTAVASHIDILGQLVGVDGASLIASIAVVEARHATLLKAMAGVVDLADQIATEGKGLSPSDYAVE